MIELCSVVQKGHVFFFSIFVYYSNIHATEVVMGASGTHHIFNIGTRQECMIGKIVR